ncbi:MAG: GPW/gp25 family protein [Bacteroidaceae bacterium]|nr:GPW/gp25 family protein [Bacteroidaceae bacterium]
MTNIALPLRVTGSGIVKERSLKRSIDGLIDLLLTTPLFSATSDPFFGFVFNNVKFEIFNEHEGVVYDSSDTGGVYGLQGLYDKKISGSSRNMNTYAAELKEAIVNYEKRLDNVTVSMTYMREERQVYVTVKGVIIATKKEYVYRNILKIWN